jgi:hypothetical protein
MRYSGTSFGTAALLAAIGVIGTGRSAAAQMGAIPGGWYASGSSSADYKVGSDVSRRPSGSGMTSGYIKAAVTNPLSWAALTQSISADHFRGRRVQLTGYVRRGGEAGTARLSLRIERKGLQHAADYAGATVFVPARESEDGHGWIKQAIVVDIPEDCTGIRVGLVSTGASEAWLDDVKFETVGATVALVGSVISAPANLRTLSEVTGEVKRQETTSGKMGKEFVNLDFESPLARRN